MVGTQSQHRVHTRHLDVGRRELGDNTIEGERRGMILIMLTVKLNVL